MVVHMTKHFYGISITTRLVVVGVLFVMAHRLPMHGVGAAYCVLACLPSIEAPGIVFKKCCQSWHAL
jgi:hypothetical protein